MDVKGIVVAFNDCINRQDVIGLGKLMHEEHTLFIESDEPRVVHGKKECLAAWEMFFAAYPDYKNVFEKIEEDNGRVVIHGYSTCSVDALDGPCVWEVKVVDDKVFGWKVKGN